MAYDVHDREVAAWLASHPSVARDPQAATEKAVQDRVLWHEMPDDVSCMVCGGSGLVQAHVLNRFAVPGYDACIGVPVRCGRSQVCGWEKLRCFSSDEGEVKESASHRWAKREELPALPKSIADRWDRQVRQEARDAARMTPDERQAAIGRVRTSIAALTRGSRGDAEQTPADDAPAVPAGRAADSSPARAGSHPAHAARRTAAGTAGTQPVGGHR